MFYVIFYRQLLLNIKCIFQTYNEQLNKSLREELSHLLLEVSKLNLCVNDKKLEIDRLIAEKSVLEVYFRTFLFSFFIVSLAFRFHRFLVMNR